MKTILLGTCAVVLCVLLGACVSAGHAPQNVKLESMDGKAVIIKDIYELPRLHNKKLSKTEMIKVFFPDADNVQFENSITLLKIASGVSQAKHKQSSSQIIYAISGGGKLLIDNNMIILKKGIMVYVPPNAIMSITNNTSKTLELIVVTSPPFEISQLTVLGKAPKNVRVSVEAETNLRDDNNIQAVAKKYRTDRERRRTLSVEEYRDRLNDGKKDPLLDLLNITEDPKSKKPDWPLKMPDSDKVPLKVLEQEQLDQLLPPKAQKIENTSTGSTQTISPKEQAVPIYNDREKEAETSKDTQESLSELLKDQNKYAKKIIPGKAQKFKKGLRLNIQELSPKERGVLSDEDVKRPHDSKDASKIIQDSLDKLLKSKDKYNKKVTPGKTSLKNVQELSPEERGVPVSDKKIKLPDSDKKTSANGQDSLEQLLKDQKKRDLKIISEEAKKTVPTKAKE